jgi:hypothetical protein
MVMLFFYYLDIIGTIADVRRYYLRKLNRLRMPYKDLEELQFLIA